MASQEVQIKKNASKSKHTMYEGILVCVFLFHNLASLTLHNVS